MEVYVGAKKRKYEFKCSECGERNVKWINKKPETEIEKIVKKVIVTCTYCEAVFKVEPED